MRAECAGSPSEQERKSTRTKRRSAYAMAVRNSEAKQRLTHLCEKLVAAG
jgi:hypothetical protein